MIDLLPAMEFPNGMVHQFSTGLNEGLEAALVVGVMAAYVARLGHPRHSRAIWIWTAAALITAVCFSGFLMSSDVIVADRTEQIYCGILSAAAVVCLTWMVFWMRRNVRELAAPIAEDSDELGRASWGSIGLGLAAFLAIAREIVEVGILLQSSVRSAGHAPTSLLGLLLGFLVAGIAGVAFDRWASHLSMDRFFRYVSIALVVVVAGVLADTLGEFQELGWLPGHDAVLYDVSERLGEGHWLRSLVNGTLGLGARMTWLGAAAYGAFVTNAALAFRRHPLTATH